MADFFISSFAVNRNLMHLFGMNPCKIAEFGLNKLETSLKKYFDMEYCLGVTHE